LINEDPRLSLKNNIDMVKDELNSEEKFFEKAVMTERFVTKYKTPIIASIVAVVVFAVANIAYDANESSRKESANTAFMMLQTNPEDANAIKQLKENSPKLYDVWLYSKAVAANDTATLKELVNADASAIADLSSYELAQESKDAKELSAYASKDKAIYKDLAYVQSAVLYLQANEQEKAQAALAKIAIDSPLANVADALRHYGVK
jgi:hypothetical protein